MYEDPCGGPGFIEEGGLGFGPGCVEGVPLEGWYVSGLDTSGCEEVRGGSDCCFVSGVDDGLGTGFGTGDKDDLEEEEKVGVGDGLGSPGVLGELPHKDGDLEGTPELPDKDGDLGTMLGDSPAL